jgi:hypothetical protein
MTRLGACIIGFLALMAVSASAQEADFWGETRRGANSFNRVESGAHLAAAKAFGVGFVRVAIDKWRGEERDFLAGDLDQYDGLVAADVAHLRAVLDEAAASDVPVVLTLLGLPGARATQLNGDQHDVRLWQDRAWWDASARYWSDIARAFKDHPAIVGYNILNEPTPEFGEGVDEDAESLADRAAWCARVHGTPRDLDQFYRHVVAAIRVVDANTPIILDAGFYAQPVALQCLTPLDDPNVLYAVHMYEPYQYTTFNRNRGRWRYPGSAPYGGAQRDWDAAALARHLQPMADWADAHGVPRNRLLLGEFGCDRRVAGCAAYLRDVIGAAEAARMHWAFYSFREDVWDAMDYEIGAGPTPPGFWNSVERGETPNPPRAPNPMADTLQAGLRGAFATPTR